MSCPVSDINPMFSLPTNAWVLLGFSGFIRHETQNWCYNNNKPDDLLVKIPHCCMQRSNCKYDFVYEGKYL